MFYKQLHRRRKCLSLPISLLLPIILLPTLFLPLCAIALDPHLAPRQVRLEGFERVVGVLEVAVHQRQAVQLVERQQLRQRQPARQVLVVFDV